MLVVHMVPEQSGKTQHIDKLDDRNQSRLAGQVPPAGLVADLCGCFARRPRLFGSLAYGEGDSSR